MQRRWDRVALLFNQLMLLPDWVLADPATLESFTADVELASSKAFIMEESAAGGPCVPKLRFAALLEQLAFIAPRFVSCSSSPPKSQEPLNGGVSNGGFPDLDLSFLFCPFFFLFGTFPIFLGFSRFARGWSGDFPDSSLLSFSPNSRPIKSTYKEESRKGPRHNRDLSQKKWETTRFGNPPV